ncbi:hypothetical protein ABFS83_12G130400 [Erythranthe nasuta]|uniref:DUF985 domain-containing protein n=1 Tax=Erythranthe guttata TaxID=4155 RepID=A0A022QK35_ERYGU|nr:PREDICTED: uncharacterized protein LOC105968145 [Erythranthe guttata]EYU28316.1 hypothetical protein MIMGU_mgv1a014323mg [Erythranthe guttata]|eukprot:XP_012848220.1 PREDICTED: uncharacterized protein LOC105968145 [Erythranthe guttata]
MGSRTATKSQIVEKLDLKPHPEGGFYSETFRDSSVILSKSHLPPQYKVDRPVSTCIYFLLPSGSVSHLHRIPCAETWHFYLGDPLTVVELDDKDGSVKLTCLGPDPLAENQVIQYVVPPNVWFGAFPTKDIEVSSDGKAVKGATRDSEEHFSLVGCTCAPAFQFDDFELAKRSELIARFNGYESLITMLTFPE